MRSMLFWKSPVASNADASACQSLPQIQTHQPPGKKRKPAVDVIEAQQMVASFSLLSSVGAFDP